MVKKLKIIFYTDDYLPNVDGTVNYIVAARKELERRGHKVYVFTAGTDKTKEAAAGDRRVFVFKGIPFRRYPQYTIVAMPKPPVDVKNLKPDIIHMHTPFSMGVVATMAKKSLGVPLVGTFHTMVFSDEAISTFLSKNMLIKKVAKSIMIKYLRYAYSKCDIVLTPSNHTRHSLEDIGIKNTITLQTGILSGKVSAPSKEASRKKLGIPRGKKLMLYLGRVSNEKNIEMLIHAAEQLSKKGFDIIIAGEGPSKDALQKEAEKRGVSNITFAGFVPDRQLKYYYAAADVFCNPSMFETLGQTTLSAMAYGVPVLVPKGSAQEEFVSTGVCGESFTADSISDLVRKALRIAGNRRKYSPASVARDYSIKESVDDLLKVYYTAIALNKASVTKSGAKSLTKPF